MWQSAPVLDYNLANFNALYFRDQAPAIMATYEQSEVGVVGFHTASDPAAVSDPTFASELSTFATTTTTSSSNGSGGEAPNGPLQQQQLRSHVTFPILLTPPSAEVAAVLLAIVNWGSIIADATSNLILPVGGAMLVLDDSCDGNFTFRITKDNGTTFLGAGVTIPEDAVRSEVRLQDI
jgi:hypothetical protein